MDMNKMNDKLDFTEFYRDFEYINIKEKWYNGDKEKYLGLFEKINFKEVLSAIQDRGLNDDLFLYKFGSYAYDYYNKYIRTILVEEHLYKYDEDIEHKKKVNELKKQKWVYADIAISIAACYLSRCFIYRPSNRIYEYDGLCAARLNKLISLAHKHNNDVFYEIYKSKYPDDEMSIEISASQVSYIIDSYLNYLYLIWSKTSFYFDNVLLYQGTEIEDIKENAANNNPLNLSGNQKKSFFERALYYMRKWNKIEECKLLDIINS